MAKSKKKTPGEFVKAWDLKRDQAQIDNLHRLVRELELAGRDMHMARECYKMRPDDESAIWVIKSWVRMRKAVDAVVEVGIREAPGLFAKFS